MANINAQFNYSANFGPVIGQMQKLTTEANLLNNTLQNLDKQAVGLKTSLAASFASDLGKIGGWNAKMVELTDSVDQFGQSLLKQKLTLRQYAQEAIGAFTKSSNAHKLAVREVAREMSQLVTLGKGMDGKQMGMMITPATINLKDFNTQMAVSQKQWSIFNSLVQDGTTHLINFGKNTQWAGRQITVGLTVPLTIYGNAVSKIFREVDAELTRFQKVYGSDLMNSSSESTNSMVNDVRNLAIEFSRSFGIAAKETASLAADLAATGLEGQKLLASLRETTRLAVLGDVSNQDAMKTTLALQNAFKISTDDLAQSVNFLNAVENQTSLSLQDLTTAIPKAGPVVKSLGGDVKDLSLLMVALKEGGISAAEGANALKSGMASLINPTKQASMTAKQYGIDIEGIVQANRGQLMPTIIAFQQQLQLLDDFGKAQVIENVFGKYQFARLSALFDNLNASASQTNAVLGLMGKSNKELAATAYQEMDTLMNSSSKRFQRAIEGIKAQFISIGGSITASITPILESIMGKIGKAIEFFQNLPKPVKSFIKVATGLTAIAGPIIMMVGIFSNFLGYIGKGAMGMVNLGRRMAGLPTQKFEMLSDTQIMAAKATQQLSSSFDIERSSVERLNQALGLYRQNLVEAINLNPAFLNRQVASAPRPSTITGIDIAATPTSKLQKGGSPFVPGSGNGDKVPAMLEPGEYVVNKKAAAQNSALLDDINFRQAPRFQMGGRMPGYASQSKDLGKYPETYKIDYLDDLDGDSFQLVQDYGKGAGASVQLKRSSLVEDGWLIDTAFSSGAPQTAIVELMVQARKMVQKQGGDLSIKAMKKEGSYSSYSSSMLLAAEKMGLISFSEEEKLALSTNFHEDDEEDEGLQKNTFNKKDAALMITGTLKFIKDYKGDDRNVKLKKIKALPNWKKEFLNQKQIPLLKQMGGRIQSHADESFRAPFNKTDKEYETIYKWIAGELDYFRRRKNVKGRWTDSEKFDAERYQELLSIMRSVPEGTKMMRGSILNPGMSGEMSKEAQLAMLTAIQTGDYGSLYGMDISFNDFASFASDAMGPEYGPRGMKGGVSRFSAAAYRKLYRGVHSRDTESGRFFDNIERQRATGKESKYGSSPVMYDFTAGPNTQGRDISMGDPSTGAPYPKYRDSWINEVPDEINEVLTYRPQGTITGVSSDLQSRQPIIHMQGKQMGGRINSAAGGMVFAHSVPPQSKGPISLHYPIGFNIPRDMNEALRASKVKKQDLIGAINKPGSTSHMSGFFNSFARKNPKSGINSASANVVKSETLQTLRDAPPLLNDPMLYAESLQSTKISEMYKEFKKSGFLSDFRANISEKTLLAKGFKKNKNGQFVSPDGKMVLDQIPTDYGYKYVEAGGNPNKALARSVYTGRQRSFTSNPVYDILMGSKAAKKQSGGRVNGYAAETTTWAKKAAAPKAYAGVLQGIPNWATKPAEYEAIVSALRAAGIPEADTLAGHYIKDVLAHINPSTTNANGVYEKVWAAANLMKDSQVYNVFLETLNSRKDIGGLLNPSTVSRVAAASGLPVPVVQAELTKMADGVHPNTANGARVMMTLARLFPSKTSPGMPIAVAAGLGARLQGNFYDTLGQRALPSNLPNVTVRSYDPKGAGAPTSSGQGSKVRSTGLIMPSGAMRPSMVMPNIQSISSAAGGTGTSATVKVDGMGNVLSNGIDDMVANTVTGQPIAVSSKELLAIAPGGGIAGVTSPGDEARGNVVHPMGTALIRGKSFQQKRLKGFAATSAISGLDFVQGASAMPAQQQTEPVYQGQINPGNMNKFAASIGFLTSGAYTLSTAFQQFTSTAVDGADKFTKLAAATTLAITGIQGVSQMLVDNGKIQAMQNKAQMMQAPGSSKMSSGLGKMLGAGSKALGVLGGPMGMLATSVAISAVNKGIAMYQAAVQKAKAAGQGMFKDPIEGAKLLGITLKDTSAIAQTYSKVAQGLGMKGTGKGAYDKTYADVVKKDYGDLIDSLKIVLNQEEKRNKLLLTYINLTQKGFNKEDARDYVREIARQSGAMSAFNSINLDSLKTTTDIANQTVASTKALMSSIGKVDSNLLGKYINKKTGTIYNTLDEAEAARKEDPSFIQRNLASDTAFSDIEKIDANTGKTLSAGILGSMSSLGLDEKQLGEAIAGALKTAYSIAATDPSAANQAGAMIIENIAKGTQEQQEAANASILEMMKEAGASNADLGYNFVLGGGLTEMANDLEGQFAGMGPKFSNAILSAIQSGNIDMVNEMLEQSGGDPSPEVMQNFVNKIARIQALAKIDLEVDIQLEQTKKQLEDIKTELGKTFDALIASKQAEIELENKRHDQSMKNLDREAQRISLKKEALSKNTEYYLDQLQKEKEAEDYYSNQRKTGLGGLKALSQGDVFGFIGAQMDAATSADQFGRDRSLQNIKDTSDAAQEKLDQELKGIEDRKAAEAARHEAELLNIEAEIEFLNQKRAVSVGAAEKAMSKIEKVVAMSPSDPGYQAAVQEAMGLATTAGMEASQVLQNVDTSSMTKEELVSFNQVKKDLGLVIDTFKADTETALGVLGKDIEPIVQNIVDSLGASGDILSQVVTDLNQPIKPGSAIATVAQLAGINVGTGPGGVTGGATAGNTATSSSNPTFVGSGGAPAIPRNGMAGSWYQDPNTMLWWKLGKNDKWESTSGQKNKPSFTMGYIKEAGSWTPMASGGMLSGPGTGTSDSIPIMASDGEYVLRADVVKRIGKAKLDQINNGGFAMGGLVGSMSSMPSAPGMAAGGFVGSSTPSTPKYNIPSAGGGMSPSPIAQMARGGQVNSNSSNVNSSPVMNFNGAGMDMVMHHVNKAVGGRINSNSRRIG